MDPTELPDAPDEESTLPSGARLGKYQIVRLIGAGGMGAVYEGAHTEIGKRVAIKTLAPAVAAIPGARQRFLREAQLTARLQHPHIVDLSDMGAEGATAYLVMELLAGEDLAHRLARTGPISPRELVDLMLPVCSALVAAHEAGIVHRDLKPQNIFLANGPRGVDPKVLDFGISKSNDADSSAGLTSTGSVIGTPHYLAPEQIKDARAASAASDQFSIGVIFYKCLTDVNPFEGDSIFSILQAIVTETPVPLRTRRADLPPGFDVVVERAMRKMPWERYSSIRELGGALLPYASARTRAIWEETFASGPEQARAEGTPRESHTMPMPTPEQPVRVAGAVPTPRAPADSGTLPPAVTTSLGLDEVPGARRGRTIAAVLAGAVLAVAGVVLFSRSAQPPAAPATPAASPVRPVVSAPPAAPPVAPPAAVAPPAPPTVVPPPPAVPKEAPPAAAEAHEPAATADEKAAKPAARDRSRAAAHGASHRHAPAPAAAPTPRALNPNGAPVLD